MSHLQKKKKKKKPPLKLFSTGNLFSNTWFISANVSLTDDSFYNINGYGGALGFSSASNDPIYCILGNA